MMGIGPSTGNGPMSIASLPAEAQKEIPFLIEPYRAYRCWQIDYQKRKYPFLRSITYKIGWPRRRPARSHCLTQWRKYHIENPSATFHQHSAPDLWHKCGIYSLKNIDDINTWTLGKSNIVFGTVLIWGRVFEYERGYLSEYAYPLKILGTTEKWELDYREVLEGILNGYGIESEL